MCGMNGREKEGTRSTFLKIRQNGESHALGEGYIGHSSEGAGRAFTPHVLPGVQQRRGRSSEPKHKA